jgi:hypothetical protein
VHQVSAKLVICGKDFYPVPDLLVSKYLHRTWREGDLVAPKTILRFKNSGLSYELLHEHSGVNWLDIMLPSLRDVATLVANIAATTTLPSPELSIFIETDGSEFPPIHLTREFLSVIELIDSKIDIDVVASL